VIKLSAEAEPEIYATTRRFGTVLENVVMDPDTRELDLDSERSHREHARRLSDRLHPNASADRAGGLPKNIVMLTADAFGVMPPISSSRPSRPCTTSSRATRRASPAPRKA
jgi:phosphoenolpyruvate carboxykinase (ATP)